jgi:hypothetical protein
VVLLQFVTAMAPFAFGTPADCKANNQIAEATKYEYERYHAIAVYTQPDVQLGPGYNIHYIDEKPGKPSPTLRIARWDVQCAVRDGVNRLVFIAAPDHSWRVKRDLAIAVKEIGANIQLVESTVPHQFIDDSWYSGDSTQPRTLTQEAFLRREAKLRKMPEWIYKLIAS